MGADSVPVRMRGTCIDITDRVLADAESVQIAARFQSLVESAPDAILVLDEDQRILERNQQAREMLGGDPQGHAHPRDPAHLAEHRERRRRRSRPRRAPPRARRDHGGGQPGGRRRGDSFVALFLRDAEPRLASEALASRLGEAHLRRRQALEINDNVVQGLVAAAYALDQGQTPASRAYLDQTLSAARAMMDDLLEPLDGEGLQPGDLVRTTPAAIGCRPKPPPHHWRRPSTRKTRTGSSSSTTPRTSGCCCVRGWRRATG